VADIEVKVESNLARVLREMRQQSEKVHTLLPAIAEMLVSAVEDVFEAEGPGWEPLAESTLKARRGTSHKILQDTGLFAGIDPAWGDTYAEAAAGVSYAIFHVEGTVHMPKRNPFDLGPFESPLLDEVASLITTEITS